MGYILSSPRRKKGKKKKEEVVKRVHWGPLGNGVGFKGIFLWVSSQTGIYDMGWNTVLGHRKIDSSKDFQTPTIKKFSRQTAQTNRNIRLWGTSGEMCRSVGGYTFVSNRYRHS